MASLCCCTGDGAGVDARLGMVGGGGLSKRPVLLLIKGGILQVVVVVGGGPGVGGECGGGGGRASQPAACLRSRGVEAAGERHHSCESNAMRGQFFPSLLLRFPCLCPVSNGIISAS